MSGNRPFVRQLGYQPGVQLNPLADDTDGATPDNSDQVFAVPGRFTRGRIDRAFLVDRSNLTAKTGAPESIRTNVLNEAKLQTYEALNNGGSAAVVVRMTAALEAVKSFALINMSGAVSAFTSALTVPGSGWSIAVLDHECFNDGIKLSLHAETESVSGIPVVNKVLTLRIYASDDVLRYEFTGSVDPLAKDGYGQSMYLPDVVNKLTDNIEVTVADSFAGVLTTSDAYGRAVDNKDKWVTSSVLTCFVEGLSTYGAADYDRFIDLLRDSKESFGFLVSGGTQVVSFLGKLALLATEINVQARFDLPGGFTPLAAIALEQSLSLDNHYVAVYWSPIEADDPMNGGKAVWGASGLNVGYACARNARINGKGFAPKQYPIAGKDFPVARTGVRQIYRPREQELSDLARNKINPVIFINYNGGGRYVFSDCLTTAKSLVSYKKLTTVAEMSAWIDGAVTMYANELLMLPMGEFIKKMNAYLDTLLSGAEASGWLKKALNLGGAVAFKFGVVPSQVRPADLVMINYWVSYDGVARQVIVQQTLTR